MFKSGYSDTAGYQHDLLGYCRLEKNRRFGKIEFAVGCDVTPEFKKTVLEVEEKEWKPIYKETKNGERKKTGPGKMVYFSLQRQKEKGGAMPENGPQAYSRGP